MKILYLLAFLPVLALALPAEGVPEPFFNPENPSLSPQEKAGLAIGQRWRTASATGIKPVAGGDGSVQFLFGATQPSVVCAVLQVCDIELQPGEIISNFNAGDQVRWRIEPARSGSPQGEIEHVMLKPLDVGLRTSLIITTDRRTYYLQLVSHRTEYMPRVSFAYPDDVHQQWAAFKATDRERQSHSTSGAAGPGIGLDQGGPATNAAYLDRLDFNYRIEGEASWKPVRVFNDGRKTILQLPDTLTQMEAPSLLVLRGEDSLWPWGEKAEEVMVNYRVQGNRYVVDSIPERMLLIAGAGEHQTKVTITREEKEGGR
ncbi:P-type conjugative transfer protein TrbG [Methylotetracoccus oryzae]|uniref:P-type conjugative transfer protein TrbG n=1 Tax=Methylotetracoccus oryzae TaxID=1919059 RepID=UPI00111A5BE2|nr:P-type conjugative transfer protein TrbG [Methylotetracoccus oryzae]